MAPRRSRTVSVEPPELGRTAGLAYARFAPEGPPWASLLVLHGAGSRKESHYDFGRAARSAGLCALCFDARGHGESDGPMGAGVLDDLAAMAASCRRDVPLVLRGSSMGGYLAIVAATALGARAVVAICPAPRRRPASSPCAPGASTSAPTHRRSRRSSPSTTTCRRVAAYEGPLLLLHAEGDEAVPVEHSGALDAAAAGAHPRRVIVVPGGHHRSIQHDAELQGEALRFVERALRP